MRHESLGRTLNVVSAKLKDEKAAAAPVEESAKPTFHARERERRANDPENKHLQDAIEAGKARAADFMKSVLDKNHPDHEGAFRIYQDLCGMDTRKAVDHFIESTCREKGARPFEIADPGYEQNIIRKYKPQGNITHEALAFFDIFKSELRAKWDSKGYKGDTEFLEKLSNKYNLPHNDQTLDMRNIKPKD